MDLNVLIRGQSNAYLFADRGGAAALEKGLEARLGVDVHLLYEWGTDSSTIHSATAFLDWDTDGQQQSLLRYVRELSGDLKDNPTATVWMHNEYDQKNSFSAEDWLREVRTDAAYVRDALGQDAGTTPYTFVPIRYPYGGNWEAIGDGMEALDNDASFNAEISWAAQDLAMDGDGFANSSHMGNADAVKLGERLAESMAESLRPLANGSTAAPAQAEPQAVQPPAPAALTAGSGADSLVLKISQDAYQGSAQYTVSVDGVQVGETFTASAWRSTGESDTLTLKGDWGAGAHKVEVKFLNDAYGGTAATDRNLYVDSATYNGQAVSGAAQAILSDTAGGSFSFTEAAAPEQPVVSTPAPLLTAGSGPDTLVLKIAQDAYQGDAQYTVSVDGVQVGGIFTASALKSSGQSDTLTLKGDWGAGVHEVEVKFLNDAYDGTAATDRNLHVNSATYNGQTVGGAAQAILSDTAVGSFSFTEAAAPAAGTPATLTAGSGADSLVLKISQDAYQGAAQYQVFVDGEQVGGTFDASALKSSGQSDTLTLKGDWGAGAHEVEVRFLNDAYDGTAATDRNLHVDGATYNGAAVSGAAQPILSDTAAGAFSFTEAAPAPSTQSLIAGSGADSLVLKISQDAYNGDAQYTVSVDGAQVGGTFTASAAASHAAGQADTLTLKGDWAAGAHEVEVRFLNDAYDGTPATDRNLYVEAATYNGQAVGGAAQSILSDTAAGAFSFTEAATTPAPVATTGTAGADLFDVGAGGGTFTGGAGRDVYVFEAGDGPATITDFASNADKLVFIDMERADVTAAAGSQGGVAGLVVSYGDAGQVFLAGVTALAAKDLAFG